MPQFTSFLRCDISVSPCVLPSHLLSSLSFPFSCSENLEICPEDKQRNKAKSDEVQRTFTPYSVPYAVEFKTFLP